jgi:hypothetical protein
MACGSSMLNRLADLLCSPTNTQPTNTKQTAPTNKKQRYNSLTSYIEHALAHQSPHGHKQSKRISSPRLTANAVRKYLPKSLATAKGHLKAAPKNLRSTSITRPALAPTDANTAMTTPTSSHVRTHLVYAKHISITGQIYSDQTGRFPVTSSRGNQYIMIIYDYNSTAILAEPIKNRSEQEILRAYSKLHQYLTDCA